MATVYIGGQPFDSELLGPSASRLVAESAQQAQQAAQKSRGVRASLKSAKTPGEVRLAELRLEKIREQAEAKERGLRAEAEAAERKEAAKRATAEHKLELEARAENRKESLRLKKRGESAAAAEAKRRGAALIGVHKSLHATSLLPESKDVRFLDAGIGLLAGGTFATIAASRKTPTARFLWGLGGVGVGTLAFVEGRGAALKYGGAFVAAASGTVMVLETFGLTKTGL